MLKLIVAVGMNNELGKDNKLLWDIPEDLEYFKQQTLNSNVIMGRKTFESLSRKRGLPNRINYVITRTPEKYKSSGSVKFLTVDDMKVIISSNNETDFWIIGGAEIYDIFAEDVVEAHITCVKESYPDADTHLPRKAFDCIVSNLDVDKIVDENDNCIISVFKLSDF